MRLVLRFDGQDVQEFVLDKARITIGRTPANDIAIDNLAVSTHHATIHDTDDGVILEDMKSTNGTFVNDKKIIQQNLNDGDIIGMGKHQIIFFHQSIFSTAGSDDQSEATVMMSADFQQQLQDELSKSKVTQRTTSRTSRKPLTFFQKFKAFFGF
ncbi:FHA domain-containing protein [sulfur-oxidizing endosymbiont of Gigantopelta aegis]|uniref:FHA domain-containing protein n=1 Tax=sulfur-oxidizing endosymbiont of Gigantopelta aegis TaxID=2794934 RepID=UPI0018DD736C|nr:FHA domain-containing protein [sulfur-oxidizing endosymbiont of Gigantopelta aegis]